MIKSYYQQKFPKLNVDKQYYLREQSLQDAQDFFRYYTDEEVGKYILATKPKTIAEASAEITYCRNLFYQQQGIYWTLARHDNNQMVGAIGLYINNHHHRAELCYDLDRQYWRQGLMHKALGIVLRHSFRNIGLSRVEAITVQANVASIKILEKLGFAHEGTLRHYRWFQNASHDIEIYSLISP